MAATIISYNCRQMHVQVGWHYFCACIMSLSVFFWEADAVWSYLLYHSNVKRLLLWEIWFYNVLKARQTHSLMYAFRDGILMLRFAMHTLSNVLNILQSMLIFFSHHNVQNFFCASSVRLFLLIFVQCIKCEFLWNSYFGKGYSIWFNDMLMSWHPVLSICM